MTARLTRAGPAEILRASQKDEAFCDKFKNHFYEILLQTGGTRELLKYRNLLGPAANFLYYGLTTLNGLQTLGEEYTGVLQYDADKSNIPTIKKRLLMILLSDFGQKFITLFLVCLEKSKYLHNEKSEIRQEAREQIINSIAYLKIMAPFLERLHRAVFYWSGFYCHLSKRITGVQYVLVRYWLKNRDSLYGFKLLSIITVLQTLLAGTTKSITFWNSINSEQRNKSSVISEPKSVLPNNKCPLCLDERKNVSLTPCGHLFCWYCILEWLRTEQKCPICRETVIPSRVVPLQNYR